MNKSVYDSPNTSDDIDRHILTAKHKNSENDSKKVPKTLVL